MVIMSQRITEIAPLSEIIPSRGPVGTSEGINSLNGVIEVILRLNICH